MDKVTQWIGDWCREQDAQEAANMEACAAHREGLGLEGDPEEQGDCDGLACFATCPLVARKAEQ